MGNNKDDNDDDELFASSALKKHLHVLQRQITLQAGQLYFQKLTVPQLV